jgi:NTP pyrophosphatase (non-canonical NTP hydrolase)
MSRVYQDIAAEVARQDAKFGDQTWKIPLMWSAILAEETGEVAQAVIEGNAAGYRQELVQVAAVAVNAIRAHDRQAANFIRVKRVSALLEGVDPPCEPVTELLTVEEIADGAAFAQRLFGEGSS